MKSTRVTIILLMALALTLACGVTINTGNDAGSSQVPQSNPPTDPPPPSTEKSIPPTSYYTYEIDYSDTTRVNGGGGPGGSQAWEVSCPTEYLVIALTGASGVYVDSIGLQCGRLELNGNIGRNTTVGARGGPEGSPFTLSCPNNQFIVTLTGRAGNYVDQISAYCKSADTANSFQLPPTGGDGGNPFTAECPAGYAVTGLFGRSGNWLDSLNLICNKIKKVQH